MDLVAKDGINAWIEDLRWARKHGEEFSIEIDLPKARVEEMRNLREEEQDGESPCAGEAKRETAYVL